MTEFKRDANDLEQRLRDHYQRRYEQPPDSTQIWARVQPQLDRQEHSQPGLLRQVKWLPGVIGRLAARQQAALKATYQEHTFMDEKIHEEAIHIDQAEAHDPRFTRTSKSSLRRRLQHLAEAGIAAVLVASLLLGWFVITRVHSTQGAAPAPLFTYTSQPGERVQFPAWTPDKRYLTFMTCSIIGIGPDCRYLVWDATTGKVKQTFTFSRLLNHFNPSEQDNTESPDGRYTFIVLSDDTKHIGLVALVNILTGQVQQIYQGDQYQNFATAAFSHNSKFLAFVGDDGYIHIRDLASGKTIRANKPAGMSGVSQLRWSTNDNRINLGFTPDANAPSVLQVWNARTGQRLANIVETPTMSLAYVEVGTNGLSPDSQRILTYNPQAGTFAVRDASTLKVLQTLPAQPNLPADNTAEAAWLAGGTRVLLVYNQQGSIWNLATGQRITSFSLASVQNHEIPVTSSAGEGRYIASLQQDGQGLEIRDALTGAVVNTIPLKARPQISAWLSDKYLVVIDNDHFYEQIYEALTGQLILSFDNGEVAVSSDGSYFAVASNPQHMEPDTTSTVQVFAAR